MLIRQDRGRQARSAFTLMEMLIVVAIIVALAGIGGYYIFGALKESQEGIAEAQCKGALTQACQNYFMKHNSTFPTSLEQLLQKDALGGPYLESADALVDPWGQKYQYDANGPKNNNMKPDIWTVVPNSNPQKTVGNWPKNAAQH
jgi:general secretion pathway protein G